MEGKIPENNDITYNIDDYDFPVPSKVIAQEPCEKRENARLLIVDRATGSFHHSCFYRITEWLNENDLLVLNDTRVIPARLLGRKETGGKVEVLLIDPNVDLARRGNEDIFECIVRASKPPKPGSYIYFSENLRAEVVDRVKEGKARLRFLSEKPIHEALEKTGFMPLPPYIRRHEQVPSHKDLTYYQTVYARSPGAVASPTAGLHFSEELLKQLKQQGIEIANITLHVGYGTFSPIRVDDVREHKMHAEYLEISREQAEKISVAQANGKRIVAVGTTVVRSLEFVATRMGKVVPYSGLCDHYIYPGYRFKVVDRMITNFHWPKSSLILLVSAFASRETILRAYKEALKEGYRFFSYGDAMLII